jgi:DNA-binding NarL/FixJ family response regulator
MMQRRILLLPSTDIGWTDLRLALASRADVCVVGEARDTRQLSCLAAEEAQEPDVVISAAMVEGRSVLPVLSTIRRDFWPSSRYVILAARLNSDELLAFSELGLAAYLLWSDLSSETLRSCLAVLLSDDIVLGSRAAVWRLMEALRNFPPPCRQMVQLSDREHVVLGLLAQGATQEQIACSARLSPRTVNRIVESIERKIDAPSQFVLGKKAAQLGLVQ